MIDTPCSVAATCSADVIGTPEHDNPPEMPESWKTPETFAPGIGHDETMPHAEDWYRDPGSGRRTPDGRRRRRAKQACWADCPMKMRLLCLDNALSQGSDMQHGIWGGYDEDERLAILAEIERRADIRRLAQNVMDGEEVDEAELAQAV